MNVKHIRLFSFVCYIYERLTAAQRKTVFASSETSYFEMILRVVDDETIDATQAQLFAQTAEHIVAHHSQLVRFYRRLIYDAKRLENLLLLSASAVCLACRSSRIRIRANGRRR